MNCRVPDSFEYPNAYVSLNIVKSTWGEFREALATRTFHINETDKALQCTFLKVLDDYLNELGDSCEKELMDILPTHKLGRGTKLNAGEKVTPERFMPNSIYITRGNRFSPAGVEWLYLSYAENLDKARTCSIKECRATAGDRFGFCEFQIDPTVGKRKIIDLTIADQYTYNQIDSNLKMYVKRQAETLAAYKKIKGTTSKEPLPEMMLEVRKWTAYIYMKLLSNGLFEPISDLSDSNLMYAPFQCMATYFKQRGYCGIIYSSTVYRQSKDLVLFDKSLAHPVMPIEDFTV